MPLVNHDAFDAIESNWVKHANIGGWFGFHGPRAGAKAYWEAVLQGACKSTFHVRACVHQRVQHFTNHLVIETKPNVRLCVHVCVWFFGVTWLHRIWLCVSVCLCEVCRLVFSLSRRQQQWGGVVA